MPSCYDHGLVMDSVSIAFFLFCLLPYGMNGVGVYFVLFVFVYFLCFPLCCCSLDELTEV